jgi:hypothetical protein
MNNPHARHPRPEFREIHGGDEEVGGRKLCSCTAPTDTGIPRRQTGTVINVE